MKLIEKNSLKLAASCILVKLAPWVQGFGGVMCNLALGSPRHLLFCLLPENIMKKDKWVHNSSSLNFCFGLFRQYIDTLKNTYCSNV